MTRVRGVNDLADLGWEGQEGNEPFPGVFPGGDGRGVAAAQFGLGEGQQFAFGGLDGGGGVDRAQRGGDVFAVLVGHEPHRGTNEMHGAGLYGGLRPGGLDGLGEAGQSVAADDEHVADPTVA